MVVIRGENSSKECDDNGKGKEIAIVEQSKPRATKKVRVSSARYVEAFGGCDYVPTRWGDKGTLEKLGILEDVQLILRNIGFQDVLEMNHVVYPKEIAQLLGTFELRVNHGLDVQDIIDLGWVRFKVNGKFFKLSIQDLCKAYGFKETLNERLGTEREKDAKVWKIIGKGTYSPAKSANISNPAIRYVHKLLAHTIFARRDTDRVLEDDIALLTNGVKPLLEAEFAKEEIKGYEDINLGILLARRILFLKKSWVLKEREEQGKVYLGGFLTPILLACNVPLGEPCSKPLPYLDMNHLLKSLFIGGKEGDMFAYRFINAREKCSMVLLPNQALTKLDSIDNIKFVRGEKAKVKGGTYLEPIEKRSKEKRQKGEASQQDLPLGSSRYYHSFYQGRVRSEATKNALEGVKKNQRCNKWHTRAFYNIKKGFNKEVKGLKGQISDLKETISDLRTMVETFVLRRKSPPRHGDGPTSYEMALEEARRQSISHLPSHQTASTSEPPRASSYEVIARRKRRHFPTPSPPSSDNISFHLSDSYSES